jgi:hypothetical protein
MVKLCSPLGAPSLPPRGEPAWQFSYKRDSEVNGC